MRRLRLVPRGMVGRVVLVLLAALAVEFAGIALIDELHDRELVGADQSRHLAEQLVVAQRLASGAPVHRRAVVMQRLSVGGRAFNWVPNTVVVANSDSAPAVVRMSEQLRAVPDLAGSDIRINLSPSAHGSTSDLIGALRLADGSFVTFRVSPFLDSPPSFATRALLHFAVVAAALLIALAMVHALVRPLAKLASAADRAGPALAVDIPLEGPGEVRRVATAFSAMQARLFEMVDDNRRALVAVSHDLRTPIQRLRLRASLLDDAELSAGMSADLDDIERFVESVMTYLRGGEMEEMRLVDVAAIAMTAVDNAADAGGCISYDGPDSLVTRTRPLALKRALANLIDNGLRHAARVRVGLVSDGARMVLSVDDDGPGIAEARRELARLPFRRMEDANGTDGGRAGLGLAIVDKSAEMLGGDFALGVSDMGGLSARIAFPHGSQPDPHRPQKVAAAAG